MYQTTSQIEDTFNYYRTVARDGGWEADTGQFILCRHIYVDETDEKAREAAEPALRYFFTLLNRGFKQTASAEGARVREALYTDKSFNYFREENRERYDFSTLSWEDLGKVGYIVAGSPETVARQLNEQMSDLGADHFMGMFHIGNLPHSKVMASLNLFHKEVMPQLK